MFLRESDKKSVYNWVQKSGTGVALASDDRNRIGFLFRIVSSECVILYLPISLEHGEYVESACRLNVNGTNGL